MNYPQLWRSSGLCVCLLLAGQASPADAASHVVRRGETFTSIAREHRISLKTLQKLNPSVNPSVILRGQKINVPEERREVSLKSKVTARGRGGAVKGFSASEGSLAAANPGSSKKAAGSKSGGGAKSTASKTKSPAAITGYKVRQGDTLSSIARKSGIQVKELMSMNRLKDSHLSIGQSLLVPTAGPRAVASSSSSSASKSASRRSARPAAAERDENVVDISPPPARQRSQSSRDEPVRSRKTPSPAPKKTDSDKETGGSSARYYQVVKRKEAERGSERQVASREPASRSSSSRIQSRVVNVKSPDASESAAPTPPPPRHAVSEIEDPLPPLDSEETAAETEIPMTAYKVAEGDTIESIAKEFGTTPAELRRRNSMRSFDNAIPDGFLFVPWAAPATGGETAVH